MPLQPIQIDAANLLSAARLPLGLTLLVGRPSRARLTTTILLDGPIARRSPRHRVAGGAWLDPICDKVFVLSALVAASRFHPVRARWPWLALGREAIQAPLTIYLMSTRPRLAREVEPRAIALGKLATVLQFATIGMLLSRRRAGPVVAAAAGAVGVAAAIRYARRAWAADAGRGVEASAA